MNDPTAEDGLEETEQINVVPLADLTLVLLIILMVLSPMISQSMIHVAAPAVAGQAAGQSAADEEQPAPLLISVTAKGYTLNNETAPNLEYLMAALALRLAENAKRPVIVTADEGIHVGRVVEVLDSAKRHGAQKISLVKSSRVGA